MNPCPQRSTVLGFGCLPRSLWRSPSPGPPRWRSDRVFAALSGSNADRLLDVTNEDLPVADAIGLGVLLNGLDDLMDESVRDDDLDLHLRHEVDDVGRASVHFFL